MTESEKKIAVLIVAGGVGARMGHDIPKQYLPVHGRMILRHTLDIFRNMHEISAIQCVIHPEHEKFYQQAVDGLSILPACHGGETRQQSVYNGLQALKTHNPAIVLIHDAARPCLNTQDIHRLIHSLNSFKAASLAQSVTETLQRHGATVDRENLWILQTPQAFYFDDIMTAHEKSIGQTFTDDTSVYITHTKNIIHYVSCGRHNIKITTQDDLTMAERLLTPVTETRTGMGFDVHAFDNDVVADNIRLCGIDITHNKKLKGHSDADVGLHAITDAILGALGAGDIGMHFPPSNNDFKDMDSHIFLYKAVDILCERGGKINHLDVTFMCEEPKIGKFRDAIVVHLSDILKLSTDRVSVKATTTEKLGFTGRGEGIACHAIVTIQVPAHD